MTVLFVARMGILLQDDRCIQESVRQFLVHLKYLTDPVSGVCFSTAGRSKGTIISPKHYGGAAMPGIRRDLSIPYPTSATLAVKVDKIGRNDPCSCGRKRMEV